MKCFSKRNRPEDLTSVGCFYQDVEHESGHIPVLPVCHCCFCRFWIFSIHVSVGPFRMTSHTTLLLSGVNGSHTSVENSSEEDFQTPRGSSVRPTRQVDRAEMCTRCSEERAHPAENKALLKAPAVQPQKRAIVCTACSCCNDVPSDMESTLNFFIVYLSESERARSATKTFK